MKTPEVKRREAAARTATRAQRTTAEQLAYLATKPGEAKRETARLKALLSPTKAKQVAKALTHS